MRYVVDASVVVKWFVPERDSDKALVLLEELRLGKADLLAPDLLVAELGNVLWTLSTLRAILGAAEAARILDSFLELPLTFAESRGLATRALQIATSARQTMYDSLYIALALRKKCGFITADERLVDKAGRIYPFIQQLSTL